MLLRCGELKPRRWLLELRGLNCQLGLKRDRLLKLLGFARFIAGRRVLGWHS